MARDVLLSEHELLARCRQERIARGGPGGQHANRTASGVRLRHLASGITVQAAEHREGAANRAAALHRLRLVIACTVRGGADPAWLSGLVRGGRLACGPAAGRWPAVAAVLLDALAAAGGEHKLAAERLGLSPTQFVRALCSDPPVRQAADRLRPGRPPLRG